MKILKLGAWMMLSLSILIFTACGGGGGGSGGTGELSMDITDAKPLLPPDVTNLLITFEEVLVHKSGGGWLSLPLPASPYTIDLLQFYDGFTTELVPPVSLESGKYTQIRIVISKAKIWFNDDPDSEKSVDIPSGNLKTDKNFLFDVVGGGAVDITVDFDLSQSLVVTDDGSETLACKLKPVLHIVDTFEAATINGMIAYESFVDGQDAVVTASVCTDNTFLSCETYTQLSVSNEAQEDDPTGFSIFWLVPNQNYRVEIDFDTSTSPVDFTEDIPVDFTEDIEENDPDIGPGDIYTLNNGSTI